MSPRDRNEPPHSYEPRDPSLEGFHRGVGTLTLNGVLSGYLAASVREMTFPSRSPWPWFVVVWADGTKEPAFEDYGPDWWTVRELDAGTFTHALGPGLTERKRVLGIAYSWTRLRPEVTFDFSWLPRDEAIAKWVELRLRDEDF